jgi:pimeloyl-ACP methyl ester carboxylesterase
MRHAILSVILAICAASADAQARLVGNLPRRDNKPLQEIAGLETEYGQVRTSEGTRLRAILTRPAGTSGKLPAIFLAQWVSCDSVDFRADRPSQLRELARRSDTVFIRVERSGTADSEGASCSELDYDTEVRHYREALDQMAGHPWVDPGRIVIFGSSLGSTTAPLIAQGRRVAGVMAQGGGAETYLERMINFDRLYLERSGKYRPEEIHAEMLRRIPFHYEYLVRGRGPQQVEAEHPELRGVWASIRGAEPDNHYGRSFAWHQQAAKQDFLAAWAEIEAPVLVLYGEYDQFEMREGHKLIADTVNRLRPGTATFVEIPQASHDLTRYPNAEAAYRDEGGTGDLDLFLTPVLAWLKQALGR